MADPAATTTSLPCHNSTDRACGPLVWEPPPGPNAPLTVKVTFSPAAPKVGDTVTFLVIGDDPDSPGQGCVNALSYGDDSTGEHCLEAACPPVFGRWTPIATPGHREVTYTHVYTAPGTYTARFSMSSSACGASMPYSSHGSGEVTVTVTP